MGDDANKGVEYASMWGATVRLPNDMPDDVLKDCITTVQDEIKAAEAAEEQFPTQDAVARIKQKFDSAGRRPRCGGSPGARREFCGARGARRGECACGDAPRPQAHGTPRGT